VELILKLVAGLLAGLREYFLIVVAMVAVPCILLLLLLVYRLVWPSRGKSSGNQKS